MAGRTIIISDMTKESPEPSTTSVPMTGSPVRDSVLVPVPAEMVTVETTPGIAIIHPPLLTVATVADGLRLETHGRTMPSPTEALAPPEIFPEVTMGTANIPLSLTPVEPTGTLDFSVPLKTN